MVTLCDMLDSAARDAEDCGDLSDAIDPCARRVALLFANRRSRERDVRVRGCGAAARRFPRGDGFWLPMSRRSPAKGP